MRRGQRIGVDHERHSVPPLIDMSHQRFGSLTVKERADHDRSGRAMWRCVCDCGVVRLIQGHHLRTGHTQSCGCVSRRQQSERQTISLTGRRFGRLVVLDLHGREHGKVSWRCICDCGNLAYPSSWSLRSGVTRSCGCLHRDLQTKHGHAKSGGTGPSGEYNSWTGMIQRCTNPSAKGYRHYGGRGITICERWRTSFPNFLADMGLKPGRSYSIDRRDVNGNYEPGNCRWATVAEQARNQRVATLSASDVTLLRVVASDLPHSREQLSNLADRITAILASRSGDPRREG